MVEKLLAIVSLGQNIYGKWLFRRILSGVIVLAGLAIVASVMASAMLIGGFYALYMTLLHSGVLPQNAIIIVGGLGLLATILLILITLLYLRRLREMPRRLLQDRVPQVSQARDVVDAFLNGFLGS